MRVYTSRAYAARLPAPPDIADLDWICWAAPYDDQQTNRALSALIHNFKPAFTSDDFIVQMAACKTGVGAMILPQVLHHYAGLRELQELQELDIDLGSDAVGSLYLVCHKRHRYLPKVGLVMDFICSEFDCLRQDS